MRTLLKMTLFLVDFLGQYKHSAKARVSSLVSRSSFLFPFYLFSLLLFFLSSNLLMLIGWRLLSLTRERKDKNNFSRSLFFYFTFWFPFLSSPLLLLKKQNKRKRTRSGVLWQKIRGRRNLKEKKCENWRSGLAKWNKDQGNKDNNKKERKKERQKLPFGRKRWLWRLIFSDRPGRILVNEDKKITCEEYLQQMYTKLQSDFTPWKTKRKKRKKRKKKKKKRKKEKQREEKETKEKEKKKNKNKEKKREKIVG